MATRCPLRSRKSPSTPGPLGQPVPATSSKRLEAPGGGGGWTDPWTDPPASGKRPRFPRLWAGLGPGAAEKLQSLEKTAACSVDNLVQVPIVRNLIPLPLLSATHPLLPSLRGLAGGLPSAPLHPSIGASVWALKPSGAHPAPPRPWWVGEGSPLAAVGASPGRVPPPGRGSI